MKQQYFIVVLAHSIHGRLRRIHVPYSALYAVLALALLGCFSLFGMVSSYLRMAWKVANYNTLRQEVDSLRVKYQNLEKSANQTNQQLATLQLFASEVTAAYGLKRQLEGPDDIVEEGRLVPTLHQTLAEYDFLKSTRIGRHTRNTTLFVNTRPALWPLEGRLLSSFGTRQDPFSGMGGFHAGVDISAPTGTPVRAAADGVVEFAGWNSGYGKLLVVQHPGGVETYYAHLSRFAVIPGQEVRMGEVVAFSGSTGRSTAPHLHYEVRDHGSPINPYKFLRNSAYALAAPKKDFPF
ncbi:MAG: M23 family metallopeptidase [Bryobacterales bacterium]|nr:M23 family metallopeptidase [Bryobacterales bacterium]